MRTRTKVLLLALATGFVALNLVARNHARCMLRYADEGERTAKPESLKGLAKLRVLLTGVNLPRPHFPGTPADIGLAFEPVVIPTEDGGRLGAWFCPGASTQQVVLLFHGYGADKASQRGELEAFHELGLSALAVDFQGSGESSGNTVTLGLREADDVAAAAAYLRRRFPAARLLFYGQSMGGAAILRAAHEGRIAPDAIIVESVFDTMLNTMRNRFHTMGLPSFPCAELLVFWGGIETGLNGFSHSCIAYARSVSCPILFLHGTDDPRARVEDARRVFDAAPGPKQFVEFPDTGHESCVGRNPEAWKSLVREFIASS